MPNRECGPCTYCCQYLTIDTQDLQVQPGVLCKHNDGKSCTIYENRPHVCRTHFCGWRLFGIFDDGWRPDKCGILITPVSEHIPASYAQEGMELLLVRTNEARRSPPFIQFLFRAVKAKIPLFVAVPGPIGTIPARLFVNPRLEPCAEHTFADDLNKIIDELAASDFKPVTFRHSN